MNIAVRNATPTFDLDNRMTIVLFAGLGGACDGLERAGFHVHVAINHDPLAIAVHKKRHPHTRHLQTDVFEVDPVAVCGDRGVRFLHASPDCTHFSVAKGGKPVSKRRRSLAWVVCRWMGKVRPEVVTLENVREIQSWGPLIAKRDPATGRVMRLDGSVAAKGERVPVQQQWLIPDPRHKGRIWRAWLKHVARLGFHFEHRELVCSDFGIWTIRKRLFGVATADGTAIVWPERTHAPRHLARALKLRPWRGMCEKMDWSQPVRSIFGRPKDLAEATKRRIARGVIRYVVTAAKPFIVPITHSGGADRAYGADEPLRTLTTAHRGEFSVIVPHLAQHNGDPRADGTNVARHGRGIDEPAGSFTTSPQLALVAATLDRQFGESLGADIKEPAPAMTAGGQGKTALVAATLVQTGYGEREGQVPRSLDIEEPIGTQVAGGGKAALVTAFLAQHNDGPRAGLSARDIEDPVSVLTTSGSQQGVIAASLMELRGRSADGRDVADPIAAQTGKGNTALVAASMLALRGTSKDGRDVADPVAAMTAGGTHAGLILAFLQHYFSSGKTSDDLADPLGALTGKVRHGLVTVHVAGADYVITDICQRMLTPEEGAAAHGFEDGALPDEIEIDGKVRRLTKTEKYHLVGNSVPPEMIRLLAVCNGRRELREAAE